MSLDDPQQPHRSSGLSNNRSFQTPEEAAARDSLDEEATLPASENEGNGTTGREYRHTPQPQPPSKRGFLGLHWPPGKKEWLVILLLAVIVIGVITGILLARHHPKPAPVSLPLQPSTSKNTVVSPLTGLQVSPADAKLPITGVMIENSVAARPQSGLSQAGVVFEALTEGGITRFLALYQGNQSAVSIGPVRSARPYFIDWLLPFDAGYAHVGGSPAALSEIPTLHMRDMNQFYYSNYYSRISSRQAPHNVYTNLSRLYALESSKGWTTSTFTGFPRKAAAPAKTPTAGSINFNPSYGSMAVHYSYDATKNDYLRSEGGSPMIDPDTGKQIAPQVVIAMVVPRTNGSLDSSNAYYSDYSDIGSGPVYIFQDGTVTQGTWQKSSQRSQIQFMNASGQAIPLNPGQTWITVLSHSSLLSYTP